MKKYSLNLMDILLFYVEGTKWTYSEFEIQWFYIWDYYKDVKKWEYNLRADQYHIYLLSNVKDSFLYQRI